MFHVCVFAGGGRCDSPVMTSSRRTPRPAASRPASLSPLKRKHDYEPSVSEPRPKRISPFLNTPKQRRDEMRKVLRMSANKFRQIEDHEACLRRFVLINNTVRKLEQEWLDDKRPSPSSYAARFLSSDHLADERRRHSCDFDFVGNSPLSSPPTALLDDYRSIPCVTSDHNVNEDISCDPLVRAVTGMEDSDEESLPSPTNESQSLIDVLTTSSATSFSVTSPVTSCRTADDDSSISERDRLILGQMDIVFNNLISVLSEAAV